jgi:hypothetical protein
MTDRGAAWDAVHEACPPTGRAIAGWVVAGVVVYLVGEVLQFRELAGWAAIAGLSSETGSAGPASASQEGASGSFSD